LAQRLLRGPLPIDLVLPTAAQIADALDAAHRNGIMHHDLKPSHVMLTDGGAKILDFGLSREQTAHASHVVSSASLRAGAYSTRPLLPKVATPPVSAPGDFRPGSGKTNDTLTVRSGSLKRHFYQAILAIMKKPSISERPISAR
jgi:serine/threonine protein kinase